MDPISQGAVGAALASAAAPAQRLHQALLAGLVGGLLPDLDVLIRSSRDPLLFLEYHRQFTHAFVFIPLGGLLAALLIHLLLARWWRLAFWQTFVWASLGMATHGLLDACTSYGTLLLWPFSNTRIAWDLISIVDPLLTVPLLLGLTLAFRRGRRWPVWAGCGWVVLYLSLGLFQHQRAVQMGEQLAQSRGHAVERLEAKPSFANIVVWKVIYATERYFYVDAVRPAIGGSGHVWRGDSLPKLRVRRDLPWLEPGSQQARDLRRFHWFSDGFTALAPDDPSRVIDVRYSLLPQEIDALWGIELSRDATPDQHVDYYTERDDSGAAMERLLQMLFTRR